MSKKSVFTRISIAFGLTLILGLVSAISLGLMQVNPSQAAPLPPDPVSPQSAFIPTLNYYEFDAMLQLSVEIQDPSLIGLPPSFPPFSSTAMLMGRTSVGATDPVGTGPAVIETEILQMSLVGTMPLPDGSLLPMTLTQHSVLTSPGQITGTPDGSGGLNFPADSFFDIFVEIEMNGVQVQNQFSPVLVDDNGEPRFSPGQPGNTNGGNPDPGTLHFPPYGPSAFEPSPPNFVGYQLSPDSELVPLDVDGVELGFIIPFVPEATDGLKPGPGFLLLPIEPVLPVKEWTNHDASMYGFVGEPINFDIMISNTGSVRGTNAVINRISVLDVMTNAEGVEFLDASIPPDQIMTDTQTITLAWLNVLSPDNFLDFGSSVFMTTSYRAKYPLHPHNRLVVETADLIGQVMPFKLSPVVEVPVWITVPTGSEKDFGDAPDTPGIPGYPTLAAHNGASHELVAGGPVLGAIVDSELDGQPNENADGDDILDTSDDEDGVKFLTAIDPALMTATVEVNAGVPGVLDAWLDFNGNGSWADPGDRIFATQPLAAGANLLDFNIPMTTTPGITTYARFRISFNGVSSYAGPAPDGEVEDYLVRTEGEPVVELDYGDAPDPTYPTLAANNGASHRILAGFHLGPSIDPEGNGQPTAAADGDDTLDTSDDEDGVLFSGPLNAGKLNSITVLAPNSGILDAWMDFNQDGDWMDAGEQIFTSHSLVVGSNVLSFSVPAVTPPGAIYARFRLSRQGGLSYDGPAPDGEVEDYIVEVKSPADLEFLKQADLDFAVFGGTVEYTIFVTNTSSVTIANIVVEDGIPSGTTYISGSVVSTLPSAAYSNAFNHIRWQGNLGPGQGVAIRFKVRVTGGANGECLSFIRNEATVAFNQQTRSAVHEMDVDCSESDLRIVKMADVNFATAGSEVGYMIWVTNTGSITAHGVVVEDGIPAGTTYISGSVMSTLPAVAYSNALNHIRWQGDLGPNQGVKIGFRVLVNREECPQVIYNRAELIFEGLARFADVALDVDCTPPSTEIIGDLGDAPDSSNNLGVSNTAYTLTGVLGRFPTVWDDGDATTASGPIHFIPRPVHLGVGVSLEEEADIGFDADGHNNILDGGTDNADNDRADDGWLNPKVRLEHCEETTLRVRIFKTAPFTPLLESMYLNVWFDGSRDGDWNDVRLCSDNNDRLAWEWIVHNFKVDISTIPPGSFKDIVVPTVLVLNGAPEKDAWVRFTLSEEPVPRIETSNSLVSHLADGRGPQAPNGYRYGETEDYYVHGRPPQTGEPGKIIIEKAASVMTATLGSVFTYTIDIAHQGGTAGVTTVMTDYLPAEVVMAGGPQVSLLSPTAGPLFAQFFPGQGPSGLVSWHGYLDPGSAIRIQFRVRPRYCPDDGDIRNVAHVIQTDGTVAEAGVGVKVDCDPPPDPVITLTKRLESRNTGTTDLRNLVPGEPFYYVLSLSSGDDMTHTVMISDIMPAGLRATSVRLSQPLGEARILDRGQAVVWRGPISSHSSPLHLYIRVKPIHSDRPVCGREFVNVARWFTRFNQGESNEAPLHLICPDLGDAPDSTNHFNLPMTAYAGITATFPTVFDVATGLPSGPMHLLPRPLHLGPAVTLEFEADIGFDSDGRNNIHPRSNKPDLDERDDGLVRANLDFNHCQFSRLPIRVSLAPGITSALTQTDGIAYLNVWVDSNRDGDWADRFDCPPVAGANITRTLEHIVIDYPVDTGALGGGLHTLFVPTSGPVYWPADFENRPAWLRVTLSERPSNKNLGSHGDGRGYPGQAFTYGETEDYLIRLRDAAENDMAVRKKGIIYPIHRENSDGSETRAWRIDWRVQYKNLGFGPATNVLLVDTLGPGQTLFKEYAYPPASTIIQNNVLSYSLGAAPPGGIGYIGIQTRAPLTTPPGTVLTNHVRIFSSGDGDLTNNTAVQTVTVPLLPPVILYPTPGTVCTGTLTVVGVAQVGAEVDLYVDGSLEATLNTDAEGNWSHTLSLADGEREIYAVARLGGMTSAASEVVKVIVDSSLFWNPLSLRFHYTKHGHDFVMIPRDHEGRLDETGWRIFLLPETTYTVTVVVCCDDPNAQVTLEIPGVGLVTLSDSGQTDPNGLRIYEATFTTPGRGSLIFNNKGRVRLCVLCDLVERCSDGRVLIDPEGTVYDAETGAVLSGAEVACFVDQPGEDGQSNFIFWPADQFDQFNPQTTGTDGYYSFFTPPGNYQVGVEKEGYQPYRSPDLLVVDEPVHHNVYLTPEITKMAAYTIAITENGFEPSVLSLEPGEVVKWLNVSGEPRGTETSDPNSTSRRQVETDWSSGLLEDGESFTVQLDTAGEYAYYDPENPANTASLVVESETSEDLKYIYLPIVLR